MPHSSIREELNDSLDLVDHGWFRFGFALRHAGESGQWMQGVSDGYQTAIGQGAVIFSICLELLFQGWRPVSWRYLPIFIER